MIVSYTTTKNGIKFPWPPVIQDETFLLRDPDHIRITLTIHSLQFDNGDEWNCIKGLVKKKEEVPLD